MSKIKYLLVFIIAFVFWTMSVSAAVCNSTNVRVCVYDKYEITIKNDGSKSAKYGDDSYGIWSIDKKFDTECPSSVYITTSSNEVGGERFIFLSTTNTYDTVNPYTLDSNKSCAYNGNNENPSYIDTDTEKKIIRSCDYHYYTVQVLEDNTVKGTYNGSSKNVAVSSTDKFLNSCASKIYVSEMDLDGTTLITISTQYSEGSHEYSYGSGSSGSSGASNSKKELEIVEVDICNPNNSKNILKGFQIVGYFIYIVKIIIPLLLIILGSIDLGKAVTSGDDKAVTEATWKVGRRAIAGVIIFFIPSIITVVLNMVNNASDTRTTFANCGLCITDPFGKCEAKDLK